MLMRSARVALVAVSLTAVAACSDVAPSPTETAAPQVSAPGEASFHRGRGNGHGRNNGYRRQRHSNRHHYRGGHHHATGRSGHATLSSSAILGGDGVTRLVVSSGSTHEEGVTGVISKLQVKIYDASGRLVDTKNIQYRNPTGTVTVLLPGLLPGMTVKLQGNVREVDCRRTDVVTVTDTVRLGPDLEADISGPETVIVGAPVNIVALVSESNGQTGGQADCVLYVDGVAVDRANGIWVAAGDAVSCAFTPSFDLVGEHLVEVRLDNPLTPDYDPSDNAASFTIDVVPQRTPVAFDATVDERRTTTASRYWYDWANPVTGSNKGYRTNDWRTLHQQTLSVYASMPRAVAFPLLGAEVDVESAGVTWHEEDLTDALPTLDDQGRMCVSRDLADAAIFYLCSSGAGFSGSTTLGYTRFAGSVTYHSDGFARTWDGIVSSESYYSWNDTYTETQSGHIRDLGTGVHFRFAFVDGLHDFGLDRTVAIAPIAETVTGGETRCTDSSPYWLDGGNLRECWWEEGRVSGNHGEVHDVAP
jgi:hypothetical protein